MRQRRVRRMRIEERSRSGVWVVVCIVLLLLLLLLLSVVVLVPGSPGVGCLLRLLGRGGGRGGNGRRRVDCLTLLLAMHASPSRLATTVAATVLRCSVLLSWRNGAELQRGSGLA